MDNRENSVPVQAGSGKGYTASEFLALIEPQYQEYKNTICQCITGLTGHAAQLAAQGQEEQLPQLRRMIVEMAEFWSLTEDDTCKGYQEMRERYTGAFDHAVSKARSSGHAPELTGQEKENVLNGLELYAQEMLNNDPGLAVWIAECDFLVEDLREQWQMTAAPLQDESGIVCGIDEFLALMEPQHRADQDTTRRCIAGLNDYAAQLAAQRQEEQIPRLRELCIEMAEFWGLAEDDTLEAFQKMEEQYGGAFDNAVSAARDSGHAPEMSEETRQSILDGLGIYAREMRCNGPEFEDWAVECDVLAETLKKQWQIGAAPDQETVLKMEGM